MKLDHFNKRKLFLASLAGIFLGFSFPPVPTGILAFFGFVPFFILFEEITEYGETLLYSYIFLFVLSFITLYWTGGFTHGRDVFLMIAGISLLLGHPIFFLLPILFWQFFRRRFGYRSAVIFFPFFWIANEWFRTKTEFTFPWLSLGNTQTYDLPVIQMASLTGVWGISAWIFIINVGIYFLYKTFQSSEWKRFSPKSIFIFCALVFIYVLPRIYGNIQLSRKERPDDSMKVTVGIIQPNIDPFDKWGPDAEAQLPIYENMTRSLKGKNIDLVVWPETAIPFFILAPQNEGHLLEIHQLIDSLQTNLITGIPDITFYKQGEKIPKSSKKTKEGTRFDSFNSSMLVQHNTDSVQKYSKMILVPFAERVPYSEELSFLNAMEWNLGLGGWGVGAKQTVFRFTNHAGKEVKFSNVICFESVFPEFCAGFVRNGAQFLTITTNDSWWGNTSGARQHKQYAVLRAIENRRWVIRCANGGISCIIDPFGHILQSSEMFTSQIVSGAVYLDNEETLYTRLGDWVAELCLWIAAACVMSALGKKYYLKIRGNTYANENN